MDEMTLLQGAAAKELSSQDALAMAELALINNDLNTCLRSLRIIKRQYLSDECSDEERDVKLALFRDAVNLYVSAFVGTGYKLNTETVYSAVEGFSEFFQWARDVRDTYAAHTFGPARQCAIAIAVDPKTGLSMGTGPVRLEWDFVTVEAVDELGKAATIASKYAAECGQHLNDEVNSQAEKLSKEEIAALPPARLHVPAPTELRMTRERFRKSKAKAPAH
jgi:hypothetical protein